MNKYNQTSYNNDEKIPSQSLGSKSNSNTNFQQSSVVDKILFYFSTVQNEKVSEYVFITHLNPNKVHMPCALSKKSGKLKNIGLNGFEFRKGSLKLCLMGVRKIKKMFSIACTVHSWSYM